MLLAVPSRLLFRAIVARGIRCGRFICCASCAPLSQKFADAISSKQSLDAGIPRIRVAAATDRARGRVAATGDWQAEAEFQSFVAPRSLLASAETRSLLQRQQQSHWHDIQMQATAPVLDPPPLQGADHAEASSQESPVYYSRRETLGIVASLLLHVVLLLLLAIWVQRQSFGEGPLTFQIAASTSPAESVDLSGLIGSTSQLEATSIFDHQLPTPDSRIVSPEVRPEVQTPSLPLTSKFPTIATSELSPTGGGLAGRKADQRAELVKNGGGNEASENAVDLGLEWLAKHQADDGSWSFLHDKDHGAECNCPNPGFSTSRTAATGLALLCFLGRNHNHVDSSEYQRVVLRGLNFLIAQSKQGDLTELSPTSMYGQGIASLALAEAFAITQDPVLKKPTQQAVDFIVKAQHPLGGWRYMPGQLGDLNVTGWQWMTLKTAKLGGLEVPDLAMQKAKKFLDSQAVSGTGTFNYPGLDPTASQPTPTAIGLLLRMYTGWNRGRDEMVQGVEYLLNRGVSANHVYFNYYTTVVLFHFAGPEWEQWNPRMRDLLINSQDLFGHQRGSWYFPHPKTGAEGGRLFNTAMSILILEVYYRHLRLYDESALLRDFPLD